MVPRPKDDVVSPNEWLWVLVDRHVLALVIVDADLTRRSVVVRLAASSNPPKLQR